MSAKKFAKRILSKIYNLEMSGSEAEKILANKKLRKKLGADVEVELEDFVEWSKTNKLAEAKNPEWRANLRKEEMKKFADKRKSKKLAKDAAKEKRKKRLKQHKESRAWKKEFAELDRQAEIEGRKAAKKKQAMYNMMEQTGLGKGRLNLTDSAAKGVNTVLDALALPQRILMKRAAEKFGVEAGQTSEESAFNIVDSIAARAGLPEDSSFANALKATAVAGLETFADPLGPLGKLAKFNKVKRMAAAAKKKVPVGQSAGYNPWAKVEGPRTAPKSKGKTTTELWKESKGPRPKPTASPADPNRASGTNPWAGKKAAMDKAKEARKKEGLTADTSTYNKTLDRDKHIATSILEKKKGS